MSQTPVQPDNRGILFEPATTDHGAHGRLTMAREPMARERCTPSFRSSCAARSLQSAQ